MIAADILSGLALREDDVEVPECLYARLVGEESGQNMIEYSLVAFLIGLAAVVAMRGLSNSIVAAYSSVSSSLAGAF